LECKKPECRPVNIECGCHQSVIKSNSIDPSSCTHSKGRDQHVEIEEEMKCPAKYPILGVSSCSANTNFRGIWLSLIWRDEDDNVEGIHEVVERKPSSDSELWVLDETRELTHIMKRKVVAHFNELW
jgi:hypothetical protein